MPDEVLKAASKELDRLSRMVPAVAEYTVPKTFFDWLLELAWEALTENNHPTERPSGDRICS